MGRRQRRQVAEKWREKPQQPRPAQLPGAPATNRPEERVRQPEAVSARPEAHRQGLQAADPQQGQGLLQGPHPVGGRPQEGARGPEVTAPGSREEAEGVEEIEEAERQGDRRQLQRFKIHTYSIYTFTET